MSLLSETLGTQYCRSNLVCLEFWKISFFTWWPWKWKRRNHIQSDHFCDSSCIETVQYQRQIFRFLNRDLPGEWPLLWGCGIRFETFLLNKDLKIYENWCTLRFLDSNFDRFDYTIMFKACFLTKKTVWMVMKLGSLVPRAHSKIRLWVTVLAISI